jgi:hypothetical protein
MIKSDGIEFLREEFAGMAWDMHDPWACVNSALVDLCEAWWVTTGECIGGYWPSQVTPYICESERTARLIGAFKCEIATEKDMLHWLDVLNRMYVLVKLAGRDY